MQPHIRRRDVPQARIESLTKAGLSPVMARLYAARGIESSADLTDSLRELLPVEQMLNADKAGKILADAIINDQHVVISCDFDVDGCSAGAVSYRALRSMGAKRVDFAMPNRVTHGYGLSPLLVREIKERFHPDLILTVDCGVSSFAGVNEANGLGINVLITDHHLVGKDADLPDALCIVNPNQPGCPFPSKSIAGVGVAFYVMLAVRAELRRLGYFIQRGLSEPNLGSLLGLVALATIADVVSLDRNNRIIVQQGLRRIRAGCACPGVNALLEVGGKDPARASVFDMGFIVGPRLNAAGRIDDMTIGLQCLVADDRQVAISLAAQLDELNRERREIESSMKDDALAALEGIEVGDEFSLVMYDQSWHQGVIGILASRLKDQFARPTILFAPGGEGKLKGSGRSIPGLHLRDAIDLVAKRNPGMLPAFGGHAAAAGITCMEDRYGDFVREFEAVVRELIDESALQQIIETDGEILNDDISVELVQEMENAVWGQGFPPPVFDGEFSVIDQRILKEKHLKLKISKEGAIFDGIWFFRNEKVPLRSRMAYSLGINEYRGEVSVQLLVKHAEATA